MPPFSYCCSFDSFSSLSPAECLRISSFIFLTSSILSHLSVAVVMSHAINCICLSVIAVTISFPTVCPGLAPLTDYIIPYSLEYVKPLTKYLLKIDLLSRPPRFTISGGFPFRLDVYDTIFFNGISLCNTYPIFVF